MIVPFLIALACSSSGPVEIDAGLTARVDAYLAPLTSAHDFQGVVFVARGEDPLVQRAYGMADWELRTPLVVRSKFRIASITKAFTAAGIVRLVERGKIAYDDPLSKYVADFPRGDKVTIRQLLLHTSGVGNPDSEPCSGATLDTLLAELAAKPLAFPPGTQSRYSNGGYALLARVIERASGQTWEACLQAEILQPLALADTRADHAADIVPLRVAGYVPGPGELGLANAACEGAWAAIGGGALLSSAPDLHRFALAVRHETLFKRSALEYPYGWGTRERFGRRSIEQSGLLSGCASYLAIYLEDDVYVVVLSNVQNGLLEEIGKGLAALTFGTEPPVLPVTPPAVASDAKERQRWLGRFENPEITTVEIGESAGTLRLRWADSLETTYLTPTGPGRAYSRKDSVGLELVAPDAKAIRMRWPDATEHVFTRIP